jgi:hypothetical protein
LTNIQATLGFIPSEPRKGNVDLLCNNIYIAKCGDGVVDNINKAGAANTDGKQGMNTER